MFRMDSNVFWNKLALLPPQRHTYKVSDDKPKNTVQRLINLCNEIQNSVDGLGSLNMEAAALSRLIYRIKGRLRCDKGLQAMLKVNRCLLQYLNLNILSELSVIREPLLSDNGPSRQMLQWFLVRLQGLAQLFQRIYKTCLEAAEYLTLRIKLGHLWSVALIALASISRIWTVSQYMVQSVCNWYSDLYSYLDKLKPAPEQWLPEGYILPQDLVKFLGEPSYLMKKQSRITDSTVLSQLIKDTEGEVKSSVIPSQNDTYNCVFGLSEDIGEHVSRVQINSTNENKKILPSKRKASQIEDIVMKNIAVSDTVPKKKKKKKSLLKRQQVEKKDEQIKEIVMEKKISNDNTVEFKISKNKNNKILHKPKEDLSENKNKLKGISKIDSIQSYGDLMKFLKIEQKRRSTQTKKYLTKNMDNFQFQMFINFISKYLTKLKNVNDKEKLHLIVNKLHKKMYEFLSN